MPSATSLDGLVREFETMRGGERLVDLRRFVNIVHFIGGGEYQQDPELGIYHNYLGAMLVNMFGYEQTPELMELISKAKHPKTFGFWQETNSNKLESKAFEQIEKWQKQGKLDSLPKDDPHAQLQDGGGGAAKYSADELPETQLDEQELALKNEEGNALLETQVDEQEAVPENETPLEQFQRRGGQFTDIPSPPSYIGATLDVAEKIQVKPGTVMYPICHEGSNRSQIMREVMLRIKERMDARQDFVQVERAHGLFGGFEPAGFAREFRKQRLKDGEDFYKAISSATEFFHSTGCAFRIAFGTAREPKQLESGSMHLVAAQSLFWERNPRVLERERQERLAVVDKFTDEYWRVSSDHPRLFVVFGRAWQEALPRLLEANEGSLAHIHVVKLDWPDGINTVPNELDSGIKDVLAGLADVERNAVRDALAFLHMYNTFVQLFEEEIEQKPIDLQQLIAASRTECTFFQDVADLLDSRKMSFQSSYTCGVLYNMFPGQFGPEMIEFCKRNPVNSDEEMSRAIGAWTKTDAFKRFMN